MWWDGSAFPKQEWRRIAFIVLARLMVLLYCVFIDWALADHNPGDDVRLVTLRNATFLATPFTKWDAAHFLSISDVGYSSMRDFAFFPLFPAVIEWIGMSLSSVDSVGVDATTVIIVVLMNLVLQVANTLLLMNILESVYFEKRIVDVSSMIFALNPATIFFSTVYTESLFTFLSWSATALVSTNYKTLLVPAALLYFLASMTRSTGLFNIFPAFFIWLQQCCKRGCSLLDVFNMTLVLIAILLPFFAYDKLICEYLSNKSNSFLSNEQFCFQSGTTYSTIQSKYWNVGLLRYFEYKQIPNFLLVIPVVVVSVWSIASLSHLSCFNVGTREKRYSAIRKMKTEAVVCILDHSPNSFKILSAVVLYDKVFPYMIHLLVMLMLCFFCSHVQITTRVICSTCPIIYAGFAEMLQSFPQSNSKLILGVYISSFLVLGCSLHCNNYPWT